MYRTRYEEYAQMQNGLPFVLNTDILRNRHLLSRESNWHENIEIQICTGGCGTVLLDGKQHAFCQNDIVVVNSNVIHHTGTDTELTYDVLIIDTKFCQQMDIDVTHIMFEPTPHNHDLLRLFWKLKAAYKHESAACRTATLNKLLLEILIELARHHSIKKETCTEKNKNYEKVKLAVLYMRDHYPHKLTLEDVAKQVWCDKYTLCKEFKKYTGRTLFEHLNRYRCIKAIECLSDGHTVAETASLCGFDNLSFFSKTFKRYIGKLPSAYKK